MGWLGLSFVLGSVAFIAIVAVKVGPLYMNHTTVVRVVKGVAEDPELSQADPYRIKRALESRWAVDYIQHLDFKDVKIKRNEHGRVLVYDYEPQVNLFYNVYVSVKFEGKHQMRNAGTG